MHDYKSLRSTVAVSDTLVNRQTVRQMPWVEDGANPQKKKHWHSLVSLQYLLCLHPTLFLQTSGSAVADMLPERLYECIHQRPPHNCENNILPTLYSLNDGDPLELSGSYSWKLERLGYNGVTSESRTMTDSVIWIQYIKVTDTQTGTLTVVLP